MKCELCGSTGNELITTKTRDGGGPIVKCKKCGLIYQDMEYGSEELKNYYNEEYFETNSLNSEGMQTPQEHFNSRISTISIMKNDLEELIDKRFSNPPKVLELGASTGELLHELSSKCSKLVGIELNEEYCDWANNNLDNNIEMISKDINGLSFDEGFDLIISNYTLDHLPNPVQTLKKMVSLLNKNGCMYLLVPNRDEALNYFTSPATKGKYQTFFWHKAHMFYFTKETFEMMLSKVGLASELTCFHEYSFRNFLQWYFVGKPGVRFDEEINDTGLFAVDCTEPFPVRMNELFKKTDESFKQIISDTWGGNTIRAIAWHKG